MTNKERHMLAAGVVVKDIRQQAELTQIEMAEKIDMVPSQLSRIERGNADMLVWNFHLLIREFKLSHGLFFAKMKICEDELVAINA
jgi:DNA-binding XRE family transcriptional regulator